MINFSCNLTYDGNIQYDIEDFFTKFDRYSRANCFTDQEKLAKLPLHLKGYALQAYENFAAKDQENYDRVKNLLKQFFNTHTQRKLSVSYLRNRTKRINESIVDYAAAIQKLIKSAYPTFTAPQKADLFEDYFLQGLPHFMRNQLLRQTFENNVELIKTAQKIEIFQDDKRLIKNVIPIVNTDDNGIQKQI